MIGTVCFFSQIMGGGSILPDELPAHAIGFDTCQLPVDDIHKVRAGVRVSFILDVHCARKSARDLRVLD